MENITATSLQPGGGVYAAPFTGSGAESVKPINYIRQFPERPLEWQKRSKQSDK